MGAVDELARRQQFVDGAACGSLDLVKELLQDAALGAEVVNFVDREGRSALHYSCLNNDVPLLKALLADGRTDVHKTNARADTVVHLAALSASLEALQVLLEDGRCSLEVKNKFGETPLHLCAGSGDKGAAKAAGILLERGASMTSTDQWGRGPVDVARDNAEAPVLAVLIGHLEQQGPELASAVHEISAKYKAGAAKPVYTDAANEAARSVVFGQLGTVQLKKTCVMEKSMFSKSEGVPSGLSTAAATQNDEHRPLSKLVEFPGVAADVREHLDNHEAINPAGKDAYGLTALHKFATWNKSDLLEMLIPRLSRADLMAKDPAGRTARARLSV